MSYSTGYRDYRAADPVRPRPSDDESRLPIRLFIAVAVLGLACYGLSFGPVSEGGGATGWAIRFSALAALSATLGLMAKSGPYPFVTAVLAGMGFLDALSSQVFAADPGWALTVIVVLNGAQTVVAIAALLLWRNDDAGHPAATGYEAYVEYYNRALQDYYGQQAPIVPEPSQQAGYGQAHGAQSAQATTPGQRASQHGEYADFVSAQDDYGRAATSPAEQRHATPPSGLPHFGSSQPSANRQGTDTGQTVWPPSP